MISAIHRLMWWCCLIKQSFSWIYNIIHYRPQTKLREGNVFAHVCLHSHNAMGKADHPPRYGQLVGRTHPTGMHTCFVQWRVRETNTKFTKKKTYLVHHGPGQLVVQQYSPSHLLGTDISSRRIAYLKRRPIHTFKHKCINMFLFQKINHEVPFTLHVMCTLVNTYQFQVYFVAALVLKNASARVPLL